MGENQNNGYIHYQKMVSEINSSSEKLIDMCEDLELTERAESIRAVKNKMDNHSFSVGIMGEFKRGKSTVINALLGKEILPADILPCSATLNQIKWDVTPRAEIGFKNGKVKQVKIDELSDYVTKLTEKSAQNAAEVNEAVVYYPCQFCQNGVRIIDTPGLNDDERMNKIAEEVLPTLDAIIMVLVPDAPFSMSEADFVRNKVMFSDMARIIFVVNKIDTVSRRDRKRVLDAISMKIQASVLEKAASIYGKDSKEYQDTKSKLGGIRIYPISGRDALYGKLDGDEELLESSGMIEFEEVLRKLLTEERGLLELIAPINHILGSISELYKAIDMRRNAMEMEKGEFEEVQKKAAAQIEEIRAKKQEEVKRLKAQAKNIYVELLPMVQEIYDTLEQRMLNCVNEYPLTAENVKTDERRQATAEQVGQRMESEFKTCITEYTEVLQTKVIERIGEEMEHINLVNQDINAGMDQIRCLIPNNTNMFDAGDAMGVVADIMAMNMGGVFGIGGILAGWRANGIPGAIVGGGVGAVAGIASVIALSSVLGVVGLPMLMISGAVSTFGGKAITNMIFHGKLEEKKMDELRSELRQGALKCLDNVRGQRTLENWLKEISDNAYYSVSTELEREVESMIQTTESTLSKIKTDIENDKNNRNNILEEMKEKEKILKEIYQSIIPIKEKLDAVNSNPQEDADE